MARRRQMFGRLPRLALSLFVTLAMVLGMCPTVGIAEEEMMQPGGNATVGQKRGGEELALQTQEEQYPLWVGDTQVTSTNAADPGGRGWSFTPAKDGDPDTLTLDGANITTGHNVNDKVIPNTTYA